MAIADELKQTKASIKEKLINKDLEPTDVFSTYPTLKFTCFKPNSTEILKTLEIKSAASTGNSKTATFDIVGEGVVNFQVKHSNWEITNTLELTINSIE